MLPKILFTIVLSLAASVLASIPASANLPTVPRGLAPGSGAHRLPSKRQDQSAATICGEHFVDCGNGYCCVQGQTCAANSKYSDGSVATYCYDGLHTNEYGYVRLPAHQYAASASGGITATSTAVVTMTYATPGASQTGLTGVTNGKATSAGKRTTQARTILTINGSFFASILAHLFLG